MGDNGHHKTSAHAALMIAESLAPRSTVLNFNNMDLKDLPLVFTRAMADGSLHAYAGVSLKSNRLAGVPLDLGKVQTLRVIWLDDNRIAALPPLAVFAHVQYLSLKRNRLTKLPPTVADLISLVVFDLSDNQLPRLPAELAKLSYLKLVIATGNAGLRSLPLDLARNLSVRVDFDTPCTFPPELSASGVLEYIEAMNARKLALSLTSHWARSELSCRVCTARFPPNKPHHCRVCGSRVCGKCSEERVVVPCFQVDEPLRVCRVCAVELKSVKCARFNIVIEAPVPHSKGSGISKHQTSRPQVEPPAFQNEADAKLAEAMGVLQRYREEHESELAALRAELVSGQAPEERRKTKAAMNTKALEAMTVTEKVDGLVQVAAKRAIRRMSKYGALKRPARPAVATNAPPPQSVPSALSTSPPTSQSSAATPTIARFENSPSPPHERPGTVFTLMPAPTEPPGAVTSPVASANPSSAAQNPNANPSSGAANPNPLSQSTPNISAAAAPTPVFDYGSRRGRRGEKETDELQAEVMKARLQAAATSPPAGTTSSAVPSALAGSPPSPLATSPVLPAPILPSAGATSSTSSNRGAGRFKAVAVAPPPLVPPPSLSTLPISAAATRPTAAPPPPLQLSSKPKAPLLKAAAAAAPPPVVSPAAMSSPAGAASSSSTPTPTPASAVLPPPLSSAAQPKKEKDLLDLSLVSSIPPPQISGSGPTSPLASPRADGESPSAKKPALSSLPPPPAGVTNSTLPSPRSRTAFPTAPAPALPASAAAARGRAVTEAALAPAADKEKKDNGPVTRERTGTDGPATASARQPLKKPTALPPPPVLSSSATSSTRKPVALPTVPPPKPSFEAVLGALDAASEALETDPDEKDPGAPPSTVQSLPVYRARRTVKPATGHWWFGISAGAAGWFPANSVSLAQEATVIEHDEKEKETQKELNKKGNLEEIEKKLSAASAATAEKKDETSKADEAPSTRTATAPIAIKKLPEPIQKKAAAAAELPKKEASDGEKDASPAARKLPELVLKKAAADDRKTEEVKKKLPIWPTGKPPSEIKKPAAATTATVSTAAPKAPPPPLLALKPASSAEDYQKALPKAPPKKEKSPRAVSEEKAPAPAAEENGDSLDAEFDLDQLEAQLSKEKSARTARGKQVAQASGDDEPVEIVPWSPWAALTPGPSILFDEEAQVSISPRRADDPLEAAMRSLMQS